MNIVTNWLLHALDLFRLMAPYLLLGFTLAGILHVLVPREWVARHLGGRGLKAAVKAALVGTPLPLCSCGVIPFADLLKRQGASRSAITSFLISTPQTGVDSILASYAMLGLPLTLWKVLTAMVSGIFGGVLSGWVDRADRSTDRNTGRSTDGPATDLTAAARGEALAAPPVASCCGGDACATLPSEYRKTGLTARARNALSYGLGTLVREIAGWLVVGTLIGGAITAFVPDAFLARNFPNVYLQMLVVVAVAVPLYVCATGSVPVAAALVMKGMPLGAAVVFLIAGPATNVATLTVFTKVLGRRTVAVYLGTIVVMSLTFGVLFQIAFPHAQLPMAAQVAMAGHAGHAGHVAQAAIAHVTWWQWACSALLGLLIARALVFKARLRWPRRALRAVRADTVKEAGTMDKVHLSVEGMTCGHCRGNVERALRAVKGVTNVHVSLEEHEATVEGSGLRVDELIAAVMACGYEAAAATGR
jgi:uncharacterized protein